MAEPDMSLQARRERRRQDAAAREPARQIADGPRSDAGEQLLDLRMQRIEQKLDRAIHEVATQAATTRRHITITLLLSVPAGLLLAVALTPL